MNITIYKYQKYPDLQGDVCYILEKDLEDFLIKNPSLESLGDVFITSNAVNNIIKKFYDETSYCYILCNSNLHVKKGNENHGLYFENITHNKTIFDNLQIHFFAFEDENVLYFTVLKEHPGNV